MAEKTFQAPDDEAGELQSKLLRRALGAGLLALVLIGALAWFDAAEEQEEISPPAAPARRAPPGPSSASQPAPEIAVPVAAGAAPVAGAAPDSQAVPPPTDGAALPLPATAAELAAPKPPAQTLRVLAERQPDAVATTPGEAASAAPVPAAVPEFTAPPVGDEPPPAPRFEAVPGAAVPEASGRPLRGHAAPEAPRPTRLGLGYIVQAGVFSTARRAEELQDRLRRAGIAARLETRVQIGPFQSREEAESARARLRELGVDSLLVPPPRGAGLP